MNAIETRDLSKRFRDVTALEGVTLDLAEDRVHGLLRRNGAGKTTLMKLLTGQLFASSGQMRVLGQDPVENAHVLTRTCFIQESQKTPTGSARWTCCASPRASTPAGTTSSPASSWSQPGWGPWMAVIAVIGVLSAGTWLVLVRRTQVS